MHENKHELRELAQLVARIEGVADAVVLDGDDCPHRTPTACELTVGFDYERVPPRVLRVIAERDCGVLDVTERQFDNGRAFRIVVA